ncbi:MAG: AAA family ATPase [Nitrosarchaeum sp.]|nr:AAA family ATPase [Nitrosarchaeum sp.]
MSVVITGNPGVGKHTVCKETLKHLRYSILDINSVAKEAGLLEANGDTNDVDVEKLEGIIGQKISDSSLVVGHLAPYVICPEKIDKVIVLRRDPYDLLKVYEERGYTEQKARENAASEILGVIAHDAMVRFGGKVFEVNVTGRTIAEISEIVMNIINGDGHSEQVDWLDMVARKNDLKKFFAD